MNWWPFPILPTERPIPNSHIYPQAAKSPLTWNCKRPIPSSQGGAYAGLSWHKYLTDRRPLPRSVTDLYAHSVHPQADNYRKRGHLYFLAVSLAVGINAPPLEPNEGKLGIKWFVKTQRKESTGLYKCIHAVWNYEIQVWDDFIGPKILGLVIIEFSGIYRGQ